MADRGHLTELTYNEYRAIWARLSDEQRERVRAKAQWEAMSLWAVLIEWPSLRFEAQRD